RAGIFSTGLPGPRALPRAWAMAQALLSHDAMANDAAGTRRREGWDTPERSPAQERFYRELMAVDRLPSVPEIAQRLLVAINREDAHVGHLTALIVRDQSLTARLLRLANSAFFSIRTRVTSIQQATTLLGFARVRDLVLGLSVWGALEGKGPGARRWRRTLWSHTSLVAAAAKTLAERTGGDSGAAFATGLLHDVASSRSASAWATRTGRCSTRPWRAGARRPPWSWRRSAAITPRSAAGSCSSGGCPPRSSTRWRCTTRRWWPTSASTSRRWSRWRTAWSTPPIPRAASRATRCSTRSGRSRRGCSPPTPG